MALVESSGHAAAGDIQIRVSCEATQGHGVIRTWIVTEGCVWVCGSMQAGSRLTYVVPVASNSFEDSQGQAQLPEFRLVSKGHDVSGDHANLSGLHCYPMTW